jgi:hypothetical protein
MYVIRYFIDHFILRHTNSIVYYPQGNGQVESTNKVFGTLLTKLVNENRNDWDEHLSIVLFHIKLLTKLELVVPPLNWYMGYIRYYLQNICYHLDLVITIFHNKLKS